MGSTVCTEDWTTRPAYSTTEALAPHRSQCPPFCLEFALKAQLERGQKSRSVSAEVAWDELPLRPETFLDKRAETQSERILDRLTELVNPFKSREFASGEAKGSLGKEKVGVLYNLALSLESGTLDRFSIRLSDSASVQEFHVPWSQRVDYPGDLFLKYEPWRQNPAGRAADGSLYLPFPILARHSVLVSAVGPELVLVATKAGPTARLQIRAEVLFLTPSELQLATSFGRGAFYYHHPLAALQFAQTQLRLTGVDPSRRIGGPPVDEFTCAFHASDQLEITRVRSPVLFDDPEEGVDVEKDLAQLDQHRNFLLPTPLFWSERGPPTRSVFRNDPTTAYDLFKSAGSARIPRVLSLPHILSNQDWTVDLVLTEPEVAPERGLASQGLSRICDELNQACPTVEIFWARQDSNPRHRGTNLVLRKWPGTSFRAVLDSCPDVKSYVVTPLNYRPGNPLLERYSVRGRELADLERTLLYELMGFGPVSSLTERSVSERYDDLRALRTEAEADFLIDVTAERDFLGDLMMAEGGEPDPVPEPTPDLVESKS